MNNAVYSKTVETFRNRINVKLVNSKKDFKMDSKTKLNVTKNILH